ncbi:MAG: ACT domain-containing protein, partial [Muribaculaceae bacterium]|nr:ACT domain-containing protein [Muribaculaceae bacterium]
ARDNSLNTFSFAIADKEALQAVRLLKEEFAPELVEASIEVIEMKTGLAGLAVVGENLKNSPTLTDRLVAVLENAGIHILAHTDKASETNTSFVIPEADINTALKTLHNAIF